LDPQLLRGNFAVALVILLLAVFILPFQDRKSAEFVVTVLAIVMAFLFLAAITVVARWSSPGLPRSDDKPTSTLYNGSRHVGPEGSRPRLDGRDDE
jgi:hypothetical protein